MKAPHTCKLSIAEKSAFRWKQVRNVNATQTLSSSSFFDVVKDEWAIKAATMAEQGLENHKAALISSKAEVVAIVS